MRVAPVSTILTLPLPHFLFVSFLVLLSALALHKIPEPHRAPTPAAAKPVIPKPR